MPRLQGVRRWLVGGSMIQGLMGDWFLLVNEHRRFLLIDHPLDYADKGLLGRKCTRVCAKVDIVS